jgi:hypothetical protein
LIFPRGNNVEFLSMYLDVADSGVLPYGWTRYAQFSLSVVNQIHNKFTIRKGPFFYLALVFQPSTCQDIDWLPYFEVLVTNLGV